MKNIIIIALISAITPLMLGQDKPEMSEQRLERLATLITYKSVISQVKQDKSRKTEFMVAAGSSGRALATEGWTPEDVLAKATAQGKLAFDSEEGEIKIAKGLSVTDKACGERVNLEKAENQKALARGVAKGLRMGAAHAPTGGMDFRSTDRIIEALSSGEAELRAKPAGK